MLLKQAHDDKNFEPLYAEKTQLEVDLNDQQPFLTIPKYGHFGQKINFPNDFILRKHTFLNKADDDKKFELLYA